MKKYLITAVLAAVVIFLPSRFSDRDLGVAENQTEISPQLPRETTVLAVGDIMLSRHVSSKIALANDPLLPFREVTSILQNADITFGNLECPISAEARRIKEGLIFRCLVNDIAGLTETGFDVVNLANNHAFDQGKNDLIFTRKYLQSIAIRPIGTGENETEAREPALIKKNQITFGFLGYSYTALNDGGRTASPNVASLDPVQVKKDIASARKAGADIVIVSMHAGTEYTRMPNDQQVEFAHAAVDGGADAVIGHHPHWVQTIEVYRSRPILYSLGNFIFDQEWSRDTKEGLAARLVFEGKNLSHIDLLPIVIENYCCARPADVEESRQILKKINLTDPIIKLP